MKVKIFSLFLFLSFSNGNNTQLETAISEIINQEHNLHVHFMTEEKDFPTDDFFKIVHGHMSTFSIGLKPQKRVQLVVIFNPDEYSAVKNINEFYLIVNTSPKNIASIFSSIWSKQNLLNVNVIIPKEEKIELLTFFPFSESHCNNTETIKVINEFADRKWKTKTFFPKKISNFHRCKLRLGVSPAYPAIKQNKNKSVEEYSGSDMDIALEIAKRLNFINDIIFEGFWGDVFENGTTLRLFTELKNRKIEYGAGWYFLSNLKGKFFDFTQPYFFVPFIVIVPPGI